MSSLISIYIIIIFNCASNTDYKRKENIDDNLVLNTYVTKMNMLIGCMYM